MKSEEIESPLIWNFWKEILNKVFTSKKILLTINIIVCKYNLCLTLSMSNKLLSRYHVLALSLENRH